MRHLLIDSNYIFKKSYNLAKKYNNPDLTILYFVQYIRYYIRKTKATKVICFWDGEDSGYYRHLIYKPYKSNRKGKSWSKNPISSKTRQSNLIDKVKLFMSYLNVHQMWQDKIEADELISDYIKKCKDRVFIVSSDSDFYQLINTKVSLVNRGIITKSSFISRYGYHPYNHVYYKTLTGDKVDKIPSTELISLKDFKYLSLRTPVNLKKFLTKCENSKTYDNKKVRRFKVLYKVVELHSFTSSGVIDTLPTSYSTSSIKNILSANNIYSQLDKIKDFTDFDSYFSIFISVNKKPTNLIEVISRYNMKNDDILVPHTLLNCEDKEISYKSIDVKNEYFSDLFKNIEEKLKEGKCRIVCSCKRKTDNCYAEVIKSYYNDLM